VCYKHSFPLIAFANPHIVIAPLKIHLHEELTTLELVNKLRDKGQQIVIFNCSVVYIAVILYHALFAIFLENKEDQ